MFNKNKVVSYLAGVGFLLALTPNSVLAELEISASADKSSQFPKIEQPLNLKLIVAIGGLSSIGAELWWFVFSKNN